MILRPRIATLTDTLFPYTTLVRSDMTRRFWVALILTLPVFVLEMGGHLFPSLHHLVPMKLSTWIQFALATPAVLWAGWPFFERGWASLKTRNLNMLTL